MAKQSLLNQWHRQHGAVFVDHNGWQLPAHFGDSAAEYQAVRSAAGLFDFADRALLQFSGPDRLPFLQGMLSNDLRPLKMFDGQLSAILTQQGKVVADVRVLCSMNSFYLDFWQPLKDKILAHLNRYLVADEVEIHDPSDSWKMLSLQGPSARRILDELFAGAALPTEPNQHAMSQFQDTPICLVRADHTGYGGFDLIVQNDQLEKIAEKLCALGASCVGELAQNILRIEAGIPRYGIDLSEDNLLLEVGLERSVSFTKGCYLGQEVVERIRSRGHVNKRLCGLLLDGSVVVNPRDALFAGPNEVGKITSSVFSPALKRPIALGYVQKEFWAPGTHLQVRGQITETSATVSELPFVSAADVSS